MAMIFMARNPSCSALNVYYLWFFLTLHLFLVVQLKQAALPDCAIVPSSESDSAA